MIYDVYDNVLEPHVAEIIDMEMKEITWKIRCEINDEMIKKTADGTIPPFSWWGSIVLKYTKVKYILLK